jgi:predicted PurR-regulated permease PerM
VKKTFSDPVIKFFISILGLFVIFFLLKELRHIFIPFVIAYFLFFFFEPLNSFLEKKKIPRGIVIFIDIVLTVSLLYGISRGIIDSVLQFTAQLPHFELKLNKIISSVAKSLGIRDYYYTHFNLSRVLRNYDYSAIASGVFSSTLSVFTSVFLILFFFIFISSGHDKVVDAIRIRYVEKEIKSSLKKMKRDVKETDGENAVPTLDENIQTMTIQREIKLKRTFKDITEQVQKYIITKFLISLTVGLIMGFILWLFDVEFFIIWAAFAVILNFIPNIGSVIAVFLPVVMALVQHGSFSYALIIAIVLIVIQNIIGNILEPKIFGDRLGLNPLVILISLLLWGYLWGIVGMFLSVPLTAVLKIVISNASSKNMRFISHLMSN